MSLPTQLRALAAECPAVTKMERWEPYREAMVRAAEALELADEALAEAERAAQIARTEP